MNVNGNDGVENESLVEESTEMDVNGNDGVENDYCVKNVDSYETLEEEEEEEEEEEVVHDDKRVPSVESSGSAGKCLNYSSVRTSSTCIFGVPVPAVRPVHSACILDSIMECRNDRSRPSKNAESNRLSGGGGGGATVLKCMQPGCGSSIRYTEPISEVHNAPTTFHLFFHLGEVGI
ncbi:hypothetical protein OIU85_018005 [Salix viminalis]|uniref:Uncharacterized protein n=1 Tax=Salix viminalis TaxID=40686 RepID=A0A9Q0UTI0_SALVM|nr:hypothetical protein OIU85_018005 [Salix viminalis]